METTCLLLYLFQLHWNGVCVYMHTHNVSETSWELEKSDDEDDNNSFH